MPPSPPNAPCAPARLRRPAAREPGGALLHRIAARISAGPTRNPSGSREQNAAASGFEESQARNCAATALAHK